MMKALVDLGASFSDASLSSVNPELPEQFSVLFVDDDPLLRKLFIRSLKGLCPAWAVRQAASGEAALQLIEDEGTPSFDLIFVDMYMASVEKQLLGSEAVSIMRDRGVNCVICGLSANDKEDEFLAAGADAFLCKPFPCEHNALRAEIIRIRQSRSQQLCPCHD
jgi:CheY-like chemotaxis protein